MSQWPFNENFMTSQQGTSHLQSIRQLMRKIEYMDADRRRIFCYPFSLNVVLLHTKVPPQEAIKIVKRRIKDERTNLFGMTPCHVEALLDVILKNTYFVFGDEVFKQVAGLPIGNSISGFLAILFMDWIP